MRGFSEQSGISALRMYHKSIPGEKRYEDNRNVIYRGSSIIYSIPEHLTVSRDFL